MKSSRKFQGAGAAAPAEAKSDSARKENWVEPEAEELVRLRAYELYEARDRADGHDVEDWLQAEAEIRDAMRKRAA